jgi:hypothetical protein
MDFEASTRLLQLAISPMVLISAVGLLLLSATNRIGRLIDRSRTLQEKIGKAEGSARPAERAELKVLLFRCEILRWSVGLLVFSILSAVLMVLILVLSSIFTDLALHTLVVVVLMLSLFAVLFAKILFLYDITLTLKALRIEVGVAAKCDQSPSASER